MSARGYQTLLYHRWKAAGVCTRCGEEVEINQRTGRPNLFCPVHVAWVAAARARYHRLHRERLAAQHRTAKSRAMRRRGMQRIYDARRAAGLCVKCGKPPQRGRRLCFQHLLAASVASTRYQRKKAA